MSLCKHRPEQVAFFTPCSACPCGAEMREEIAASVLDVDAREVEEVWEA